MQFSELSGGLNNVMLTRFIVYQNWPNYSDEEKEEIITIVTSQIEKQATGILNTIYTINAVRYVLKSEVDFEKVIDVGRLSLGPTQLDKMERLKQEFATFYFTQATPP
jgi:hypothetical protein